MLSISSIGSSGGASKYYSKEDYHKGGGEKGGGGEAGMSDKDAVLDYYTKQESEGEYTPLEWFGKGAEHLGLEGKVNPEDLEMVLERVNPDPEGEALSPKEELLRKRANGDDISEEYERGIEDDADTSYGIDPDYHEHEENGPTKPEVAEGPGKGQEAPSSAEGPTIAGDALQPAGGQEMPHGEANGPSPEPGAKVAPEAAANRAISDRADGQDIDHENIAAAVESSTSNWAKMSRQERVDAIRNLNATVKTADGEIRQPRHGWDLTFSAPKSVSIMALGPNADKRLLEAHHEAVEYALNYAQDNFSTYRQRDGEGHVDTKLAGNLLAATTQHALSRAADKQLHTHALVANAVRDDDGKWHALDNSLIFQYKQLLGGIYQAHLRQLTQGLGYNVRDGKDLSFEIAGVSQKAMDAQSTRSQQINEHLQAMEEAHGGPLTREQIEHAKKLDRPDKVTLTLNQIYQRWQDIEKAVGFDSKALVEQAKNTLKGIDISLRDNTPIATAFDKITEFMRADKKLVINDLNDSVRFGTAQVFEKTTVATPHDVILAAMKATGGKFSAEQILSSPAWKEAGFLEASRRGVIGGITTKDALGTEKAIVKAVKGELNTVRAFSPEVVERALSPEQLQKIGITHQLTEGQYNAAFNILSSPHGVVAIQGTAGAGKTTSFAAVQSTFRTLEAVKAVAQVTSAQLDTKLVAVFEQQSKKLAFDREMARQNGIKGTAPTHTARTELEAKGIETTTLTALMDSYRRAKDNTGNRAKFSELKASYAGATLLVDETSMLGNKGMLELLTMKKDLGIQRLVLSGDKMQIASMKAGAAFELIQTMVKETVTKMKEVVRQKNPTIREGVELFAEGKGTAALKKVSAYIHETGKGANMSYADINKGLAEAGHQKWLESGKTAVVITATNELRGLMNGYMRQTYKTEGKIVGPEHEQNTFVSKSVDVWDRKNARSYDKADIIVFHNDVMTFKRDQVVRVVDMNFQGRNNYLIVQDEKTHQEAVLRLEKLTRGKDEVRFDVYKERANTYQAGDLILFNKNDKRAGIQAKQTYEVQQVRPDGLVLQKPGDNNTITMPAQSHLLRFTNYAYAKTIDLAQGISAERVVAIFNTQIQGDFINASRAYIANSRPVKSLAVVVDSTKNFMKKVGEHSGLNKIAMDHLGNHLDEQIRVDTFHERQKASFEDLQSKKAKKKDPIEQKIVDAEKAKTDQEQGVIGKGKDNLNPLDGKKDRGYKTDTTLTKGEKMPVLVQEEPKIIKVQVKVKTI